MDENVLAASVGLDKAIALCRVEPLHCTYCHVVFSPWILERDKMVTEIRQNKGPMRPWHEKAAAGVEAATAPTLLSHSDNLRD